MLLVCLEDESVEQLRVILSCVSLIQTFLIEDLYDLLLRVCLWFQCG
jgi:hypothetical protein